MGTISRTADLFYSLRFLNILTTPWEEMPAFKMGLVDANGKNLRKPKTDEEKSAYTYFHRLAFNIKRLLNQVPLGKTRIASYAAALYLLKENGLSEADIRQAMVIQPGIQHDEHLLAESDESWTLFPAESGSLCIPRAKMPQVARAHFGALTQYLLAKGIAHKQESVKVGMLKPTQSEYSKAKVDHILKTGDQKSILVSSDRHVVDGHHQWVAKLHQNPDQEIPVISFNSPIRDLLPMVHSFPSSFTAESWLVKDGKLLAGEYDITMPAPSRDTGNLIAETGKIVVLEDAEPIGNLLGVSIYEVVHSNTGQKVLVTADTITR